MKKAYIIIALLILGACSVEQDLHDVTLRLKWHHQAQFAGLYLAEDKGYYEERGLNLTIHPYDYKRTPSELLVEGEIDFAVMGAKELVIARTSGAELKAVAVIFRRSPQVLFSQIDSGITKPYHLINKTVALESNEKGNIYYYMVLKNTGIDRSTIDEIHGSYDYRELLNGSADAAFGYAINPPTLNDTYNVIVYSDYGVDVYDDILVTTEDQIEHHPEIVDAFVDATILGWEETIKYPEDALRATQKFSSEYEDDFQRNMLEKSIPLIHTGNVKIGLMEEKKWREMIEILYVFNITEDRIPVEEIYTNRFITQ